MGMILIYILRIHEQPQYVPDRGNGPIVLCIRVSGPVLPLGPGPFLLESVIIDSFDQEYNILIGYQ